MDEKDLSRFIVSNDIQLNLFPLQGIEHLFFAKALNFLLKHLFVRVIGFREL